MQNFRATIRVRDVKGKDALSARDALEERLRTAGIEHWRVVDISPVDVVPRTVRATALRWRADRQIAGRLMLLGAVGWALWFFSLLSD